MVGNNVFIFAIIYWRHCSCGVQSYPFSQSYIMIWSSSDEVIRPSPSQLKCIEFTFPPSFSLKDLATQNVFNTFSSRRIMLNIQARNVMVNCLFLSTCANIHVHDQQAMIKYICDDWVSIFRVKILH